MIKPIVLYGDKVLRQKATRVLKGSSVKSLVEDLLVTMYNANGAGLAAPQIGLSKRIFIIDLKDQEWKGVFINPVIKKKYGDMETITEGCLSLPEISGPIVRPDEIEITYFDENWKLHTGWYKGIRSRVIQHEYDHLEGKLWIDRIDPPVGMHIVNHLIAIQDRKIKVEYPTV
jgi:peptide deformylase